MRGKTLLLSFLLLLAVLASSCELIRQLEPTNTPEPLAAGDCHPDTERIEINKSYKDQQITLR